MATTGSVALAINLAQNADKFRHLYLSSSALGSPSDESPDFLALLSAIRGSQFTEQVYFRNLKDGVQMSRLLLAVADVVSLQGIFFHCAEVPVAALAAALRRSCKRQISDTSHHHRHHAITEIGMRHVTLTGTPTEIHDFCHAVSQHPTLQHVCLECCDWSDPSDTHAEPEQVAAFGHTSTHALLRAVACISSLQEIELVLVPPPPQPQPTAGIHSHNIIYRHHQLQVQHQQWSRNYLEALSPKLPFLTSLRLRHLALGDHEVAFLTRAFQTKQQQKAGMMNNPTATIQQHSCPLITTLRLSCDLTPHATAHLSSWLAHPSNQLVQLAIRVDRPLQDTSCPQLLADALRTNTSLRQLHLSGPALVDMSDSAKQAFRQLLETNVHLDQVRLDVQDFTLQKQLAFYLTLNPRGRRDVFRSGRHADWVNALCHNRLDGAALYYFVRLHPGLYAHAALERQQEQEQCEKQQQQLQEQQWLLETTGIDFDDDYYSL